MTPLLILTHGEFGPVLLKAAESMYGRQDGVLALALSPDETSESFSLRVRQARASLEGCPLVLVDLACGTPWNVALMEGCAQSGGDVLAGLSLPLLLEAMGMRESHAPKEMAAELIRRAPQIFVCAAELLARNDQPGACA